MPAWILAPSERERLGSGAISSVQGKPSANPLHCPQCRASQPYGQGCYSRSPRKSGATGRD